MIRQYHPKDIQPYYPSTVDIETATDGSLLDIGYKWSDIDDTVSYLTFTNWCDWLDCVIANLKRAKGDKQQIRKINHIYAHNGNGFDWLSLVSYCLSTDNLKNVNVMLSEQMVIGIIITLKSKERIYLCDSLRLMPYSLKVIAEVMNIDHKKIYIGDYISHMQDFKKERPQEYYMYLREDCYALSEAIYRFWFRIYELEGSIGNLPLTLPALALLVFRKNMEYDITTPWNDKQRTFVRRAYSGGRVECYKPGTHTDMRVYDVNSMYPAMMASQLVPVSHRAMWTVEYDETSCGFYEITFTQSNTDIPAILRDETTKDVAYSGTGVFYTAELNLFLKHGGTFQIMRGLEYQETDIIFKSFVERYYNLRLEAEKNGDEATKFIAKILMNSLYGKFGQNDTKKHIELFDTDKALELVDKGLKVKQLDDFMLIEEQERSENEFVAIAAIITATARVTLYNYIAMFPDEYVYCDTDSIHLSGAELPVSSGLGGLKLEVDSSEGVYIGKKLYAVGDKVKAKGVGRAVKNGHIDKNTLTRLVDVNEREVVTFETFPTLKGVIGGQQPCKPITRTRTIKRTMK